MKKNNLTSRLNNRIVLETPSETSDGGGGFSTTWNTFATVWAEILPYRGLRSREKFTERQIQEVIGYRITIRYLENLTTKMRVSFDGRYFNIRSIVNPDQGSKSLEIFAEEGVAT